MDWIKIKVQHLLFSDLSDAEVGALVRIQLLTALHEKIPDEKTIKKLVHPKTLRNLQERLKEGSRPLQEVLKKVLEDVLHCQSMKEKNRHKLKQYRDNQKNVTSYETVTLPDKIREEKRREDINTYPQSPSFENDSFEEIEKNKNAINDLVFGVSKQLDAKKRSPLKNDPRNVDLSKTIVKNKDQILDEPAKHKLWNKLVKLWGIRGWNFDLIRSVFDSCSEAVCIAEISGALYPYFEKTLTNYCNNNSDILAIESKKVMV